MLGSVFSHAFEYYPLLPLPCTEPFLFLTSVALYHWFGVALCAMQSRSIMRPEIFFSSDHSPRDWGGVENQRHVELFPVRSFHLRLSTVSIYIEPPLCAQEWLMHSVFTVVSPTRIKHSPSTWPTDHFPSHWEGVIQLFYFPLAQHRVDCFYPGSYSFPSHSCS